MLQMSQTEKPICSVIIDQIRLRVAMNLPLLFQNFSSSGFQSEIQVLLCSPIGESSPVCCRCSAPDGAPFDQTKSRRQTGALGASLLSAALLSGPSLDHRRR